MLQRKGLAQALTNAPEILFLDEQMSDLDPFGRREPRELIAGLRTQGKTIFFSSPIQTLDELQVLAIEVEPTRGGARVRLQSDRDLTRLRYVIHRVNGWLDSVSKVREPLEDLFAGEIGGAK
jgi:ABC-type multidrug transport system ATPase subunit